MHAPSYPWLLHSWFWSRTLVVRIRASLAREFRLAVDTRESTTSHTCRDHPHLEDTALPRHCRRLVVASHWLGNVAAWNANRRCGQCHEVAVPSLAISRLPHRLA